MSKTAPKTSKTSSKIPISKKLDQFDQAIEWFYGDDFSLDHALDQYKNAKQLADNIEQDLSALKNEVEVLEDFTKR